MGEQSGEHQPQKQDGFFAENNGNLVYVDETGATEMAADLQAAIAGETPLPDRPLSFREQDALAAAGVDVSRGIPEGQILSDTAGGPLQSRAERQMGQQVDEVFNERAQQILEGLPSTPSSSTEGRLPDYLGGEASPDPAADYIRAAQEAGAARREKMLAREEARNAGPDSPSNNLPHQGE